MRYVRCRLFLIFGNVFLPGGLIYTRLDYIIHGNIKKLRKREL